MEGIANAQAPLIFEAADLVNRFPLPTSPSSATPPLFSADRGMLVFWVVVPPSPRVGVASRWANWWGAKAVGTPGSPVTTIHVQRPFQRRDTFGAQHPRTDTSYPTSAVVGEMWWLADSGHLTRCSPGFSPAT